MGLWSVHLNEMNAELLDSKRLSENEHVTLMNYASMLGYNKAFKDIKEFEYEELVESPMENEDDNKGKTNDSTSTSE